MTPAPIALFAYNRPEHLRQTVEALQRNEMAAQSPLYVFSDAAKTSDQNGGVLEVRQYIRTISGFGAVHVIERPSNQGLAKSITSGVSKILGEHGRIIVVEDDIVTSPFFLRFMNDGLEFYADNPLVAAINGYVYPVDGVLPETFFTREAGCWGWATWTRAWAVYNSDAKGILDELVARNLISDFDYDDSAPSSSFLRGFIKGQNDSWAVRWDASAYLKGMLTLYPGASLVKNIGNDSTGVHSESNTGFDVTLSHRPIAVRAIPIVEDRDARLLFVRFWRTSFPRPGPITKLKSKIRRAIRRIAQWPAAVTRT